VFARQALTEREPNDAAKALRCLHLGLFVALVMLCTLAPSAAAASEPAFTAAPSSPLSLAGGSGGGAGLAFSPNGSLLAEGTAIFTIGRSGTPIPVPATPPDPNARSVAFSPSGTLLAAADGASDTVSMFSVSSAGVLAPVPGSPLMLGAQATSVTFSPSGELLAVTAGKEEQAQTLYMFSVSASGALTLLSGSPYAVSSSEHVAFSPTGALLAVQTKTATRVLAVSAGGALTEVSGSPFPARNVKGYDVAKGLAFRPNGSLLTSYFDEGTELVTTYSVAESGALTPTGSGTYTPHGVDPGEGPAAFSPNGDMIASDQYLAGGVHVLSVGPAGELSAVSGSPFLTPIQLGSIAFSSTGMLATSGPSVFVPSSTSAGTDWVGALGSEGYDLAGWNGESDVSDLPNVSVSLVKGTRCLVEANTSNVRALTSPDGLARIAADYCNPEMPGTERRLGETEVKLTFHKAFTGDVRVYSVLWNPDEFGLAGKPYEGITIAGKSAELEDNVDMGVEGFSEGQWALARISEPAGGSVTISGALISGIFLGEAGPPPNPAVSSTPQGSWVSSFGHEGYDLADWSGNGGDVYDLPNASLSLVQGSRYQWAANTSDTRALQDPGAGIRDAATYYDPNQLRLNLKFNAAYTGILHLYAVDWDTTARRELISVAGQTATLGEFNKGAWVSFPISVAAGETVPIIVDRTAGANAVLSGIFLGEGGSPPAPTVSTAPEGSWVGSYGSSGYDLADWDGSGDVSYLPNATLALTQGSRYQWAANTSDTRALQDPGGHIRNAATYYDPNEIKLSLSFAAAYSGNLHLYALDWDSQGRRETITVNGQSAVLGSEFTKGAWVSFPISVAAGGTVTISVTRLAGPNAVLSGIFLGEGTTPAAPTVTTAPEGSWAGSYGSSGYDLADWDGSGDVSYLPNATLELQQGSRWQWATSTSDTRALEDPGKQIRNAATYYDPNEIKLNLSFPAAYSGNLHLYAVDWDSLGRHETITVDGQSAVLSSEFTKGAWVSFPISVAAGGTLTITVTRLAGPNAVLSGIFLGEGGAPPVPKQESSPQGSWVSTFGHEGYDLGAFDGQSDVSYLPGASVTLAQGSRYVWASSTGDTRALQSPDGLTREAATYYDPNEIKLSLTFSEAYSGALHLYALDWDSQGRREVITVNGQSAVLSSEFVNGAWVTFPIEVAKGATVTIDVTRLAGANAVLSGIFLGEGGSVPGPANGPQGTLIPLYDKGNQADWTAACSQTNTSGAGSWIIADVAEGQGVGSERVASWASLLEGCHSYGRAGVIGYVWTNYGRASIASIESQVDAWYSYYPGDIAGIFFDGVSDDVPETSTSNQGYYRTLAAYVHTHHGSGAEVVFNFGTNPDSGWMLESTAANNANLVVTFEGSYDTPGEDPYTSWAQAPWEGAYPARDFAALVYNAPYEAATAQPASACSSLARQNVGFVYVGTWYSELAPYFGSFLTDAANGGC